MDELGRHSVSGVERMELSRGISPVEVSYTHIALGHDSLWYPRHAAHRPILSLDGDFAFDQYAVPHLRDPRLPAEAYVWVVPECGGRTRCPRCSSSQVLFFLLSLLPYEISGGRPAIRGAYARRAAAATHSCK